MNHNNGNNGPPRGVLHSALTGRRRSAADQIEEMVDAAGSLVARKPGTLYRGSAPWTVDQEWSGAELASHAIRRSTWTKSTQISFYVAPHSEFGRLAAFVLHLEPGLTDAEAEQQAFVWMMALNMRRKE